MLVGNKCDLEESREVSKEEGEALAESYGVEFLETSAKETINISDSFTKMAKSIIGTLHKPIVENEDSIHISEVNRKRKKVNGKCC